MTILKFGGFWESTGSISWNLVLRFHENHQQCHKVTLTNFYNKKILLVLFFSLPPKIEKLISSPIDQCNQKASFQCCYIGMTWAIVIWDFDDVNKEYFSGKHLYFRNIANRFHFSKVMMCTLLSVKKFSIWNKRVQNAFIISVAYKCTATRKFM